MVEASQSHSRVEDEAQEEEETTNSLLEPYKAS